MMQFGTEDRLGITELQKLGKSREGEAALAVIDKICLRDEIAYIPGHGEITEFRCGVQQAGKLIRSIVSMKIDWDKVEEREKEMKQEKKGEYDYGV